MQRPDPNRHGWMRIPGVQPLGDRSIEDQMLGLAPAIAECAGKTVFDIGCAEGPITLAFAAARAKSVFALESVEEHLIVARWICKEIPGITFQRAYLNEWAESHPNPEQFDIVLALGVIHKLHFPEVGAQFAAKSAKNLLLFRAPGGPWNGILASKHRPRHTCDFFAIMKEHGFALEKIVHGNHNEAVQYWRKQ